MFTRVLEDRSSLAGLRVSAVLLALLGLLLGFYTVFCFGIGCVLAPRRWNGAAPSAHGGVVSSFVAALICAGLMYLCFKAALGLQHAQPWAAHVAIAYGTLLLLSSGAFFYDIHHPERQGPDEGFALLFMPFTVGAGLWWVVYLNLSHVRRALRAGRNVPRP